MPTTVLIVDDDPDIRNGLSRALRTESYEVEVASSGRAALKKLSERPVDVVLMDVMMPQQDGLSVLQQMREMGHDHPVVMMSAYGKIEMAVKAVRLGALDFVEKPLRIQRLFVTLQNARRFARLARANQALTLQLDPYQELVGDSPGLHRVRTLIERAAPTEGRVLVTGENGTGKELVARAVHGGSPRRKEAFITLNCAAVPAELIESELFGHEVGAFTGAVKARKGRFEQAEGGTLFLDEVGDMPAAMQAKLLRVLQEGEFERVGGTETIRVDVRVIAATNKDLEKMVAEESFREDLYYRLNVIPIHVPPLRERLEDLAALVQHFLKEAAQRNHRHDLRLDDAAMEALREYDFPGNIRELRNLVERLVILADDDVLTAEQVRELLPHRIRAQRESRPRLYRPNASFKDLVAEAERAILKDALAAHDDNMAETARDLGMERSNLYKKCRALGIRRGR